ncbi:MAG: MerR family transcriptional regulator [Candidatus Omnitrophica bacterium]|nr:MerR family transcriptional regulator [Candidatus Omnitrophota bacterium]
MIIFLDKKDFFDILSIWRARVMSVSNIYLIKDLARLTGYSIHTIKFYLKIGLIKEKARSPQTGFRYFNDETVEQLKKIRLLRRQGKSLKQIKQELKI